jgi:hypothetical protein
LGRGSESFTFALGALRAELRAGRHPPMTRLTAGEAAERLLVSVTPVREALSRLAGEGLLLDRRGQGFFVPRLEASDVEDLYRMQRDLLLIACKGVVGARRPGERERLPPSDPAGGENDDAVAVPRSEQIFRRLALKSSAVLARELDRLQDQIAPVRMHEPAVLGGLSTELGELFRTMQDEPAARVGDALGGYFDRRIAVAPRLARETTNIDSI